jgi:ATP-dependent Lon protease
MSESENQIITRSMKKKMEEGIIIEKINDCLENNNDEIDENGNLKGFIDYDCKEEEDFNQEMFQKELKRLGGSKINFSPKKKKKNKKGENNKLPEILLSYILMNALTKTGKRKMKKKSMNMVFEEDYEKENINLEVIDVNNDIYDEDNEDNEDSEEDEGSEDDECHEDDEENILDESINEELESSESSDDSDFEDYDDYDDKFIDLVEGNLDEDEELNYFHELNIDRKKEYIENIENINEITKTNIPLRFKILQSKMDISTKSIAITNINKLNEMDVSTGEYCKLDKWINGLINIPFGKYIELPINNENSLNEKRNYLIEAQKKLNSAIYGHDDAKMHILQVIGKWIKNPKSHGNVLALQGPMGNGKTTLVKEGISKAINRPFAFIALGGASDSAYFDGHSYTYEGSHWGRIIDILIESKCMNPVIYFDELDKLSETYKGDEIVHLLTHLTDPSQNSLFQDNYFPGIHLDLSKVLFIFSFNDESKIDRILKDRMYVINTKGFKPEDKISICRSYLLPELLETFLFKNDEITFTDEILLYIIDKYTQKEEGVRDLKRCLETIISKINIYYLSNYNKEDKENVKINFKIENFKLPLDANVQIIDELLSINKDEGRPPEHMYM